MDCPFNDASDTLQLSVCESVCTCVCQIALQARGGSEEMLIEIPSAMSGRVLVSEWHTHTF